MNGNTMAVQAPQSEVMIPARVERKTASGKVVGYTQHFSGTLSAKMIRESLKANGSKGKDLTRKVNEVLRGEKDLRNQITVAYIQSKMQQGFVGSCGQENKAGTKVKIELELPTAEAPASVDDQIKALADQKAKMTPEQLATLKALLG